MWPEELSKRISSVGAINSAAPIQELFGLAGVKFEARKTNWLPSPSGFVSLIVVSREAPAQTFAQLREREVLMATLSPGSSPSLFAAVFNEVFKTKIRGVNGHPSMPAAFLAMQRGEVHGFPSTPWSSLQRNYSELYQEKKITVLLQYGARRINELGDVPFARDLVVSEEDRTFLDIMIAPAILGYPYMMAAGTPQDRVAAIRMAMMRLFQDEAFRVEAAKLMLDIDPVPGEEVQRRIEEAYSAPRNIDFFLHEEKLEKKAILPAKTNR